MKETFESKLNRLIFNGVAPVTEEKFYLKSNLIKFFKNWHPDEELQELVEELDNYKGGNKNILDTNRKLSNEVVDLKRELNTLKNKLPEKKYYVGLRNIEDTNVISGYLWEDLRFYPCFEKSEYSLTLKELETLSNEKLARNVRFDDSTEIGLVGDIIDGYWINPLIILIGVEDGE